MKSLANTEKFPTGVGVAVNAYMRVWDNGKSGEIRFVDVWNGKGFVICPFICGEHNVMENLFRENASFECEKITGTGTKHEKSLSGKGEFVFGKPIAINRKMEVWSHFYEDRTTEFVTAWTGNRFCTENEIHANACEVDTY